MGGLTDERPLAPCQRNTEVARWGVYKRLVKASPNKLKLGDILAVIRELRAVLPAQLEHEGLPPIQVNVVAGCQVVPNRPDEE